MSYYKNVQREKVKLFGRWSWGVAGRTTVFTIVCAFLTGALGGCASQAYHAESGAATGGEVRVYEVFGMHCPGCEGGLDKLVRKIRDVESVESNWEESWLKVTVRPGAQLDDRQIYDAVKRANFTPGKRLK